MKFKEVANGIYETTNYELFQFGNNRKVSKLDVERKKKSIRNHGLLTPIEVTNELEIKDGQHRFYACKDLGVPIRFRYSENNTFSTVEIAEMNSQVRKWKIEDFIEVYSNYGNESYVYLKKLFDEFPTLGWTCISCAITGSQNARESVKDGTFNFTENEYKKARKLIKDAYDTYQIVLQNSDVTNTYFKAFTGIYKYNLLEPTECKERMSKNYTFLRNTSRRIDAIENIENAYNYHLKASNQRWIVSDYKRLSKTTK